MELALVINDNIQVWNNRGWTDANGVMHPANAPLLYTTQELNNANMYVIEDSMVPEGKIPTTFEYQFANNVVTRVWSYTDPEEPVIESRHVNLERDRRLEENLVYNGKGFDYDSVSKQRITGAATLAKFAIIAGAQIGDFRWANANSDFQWITKDNSLMTMDAYMMSDLGDTAAAHESAHIFAALALKNMDPIPTDYQDDQYWP